MNNATKQYVRQWLIKANDDLIVIEKLTEFEIIATSAICFHCQQLVEKHLKAFLIAHGIEFRKTHNLEYRLSLCSELDPDFSSIDTKDMSDFGVEIRYPGDMYVPSNKDTMELKEIALSIKNLVETKLSDILN